jgi:predicted enzyme related to lactoylglutathione lyase
MSGNCGITFYVEAPDVEAALVQAEKLGGTRLTAPPRCSPESSSGNSATREETWSDCSRAPA